MTVRLVFEQAGPFTSIQDAGRPGYARFGVTGSGPVDRLAFGVANRALRNAMDAAVIELSLGGATIRCVEDPVSFALCGGDFTAMVDGKILGSWVAGTLYPGSVLRIREGGRTNWAYLAFAGEIEAQSWLGSRATHALAGLGGGRISTGQELRIAIPRADETFRELPRPATIEPIATARILLGPQDRYFAPASLEALTTVQFTASTAFDRMGNVLEGPELPPLRVDMPSEPAVRGALQVNGQGHLTILSADHQTTSGYPKIAVVIGADADRVAQLGAGSPLRFRIVTPKEAVVAARRASEDAEALYQAVARSRVSQEERLWNSNLIDGVVDASLV